MAPSHISYFSPSVFLPRHTSTSFGKYAFFQVVILHCCNRVGYTGVTLLEQHIYSKLSGRMLISKAKCFQNYQYYDKNVSSLPVWRYR